MSVGTVNVVGNYNLRSAGLDGVFDTGDDEVYTVVLNGSYSSGLSGNYYVSDGPLQAGSYRFTIATNLQDRAGNGLGSNYVRKFTVVGVAGYIGEKRGNGTLASATLSARQSCVQALGSLLGANITACCKSFSSSGRTSCRQK